MPTTLLFAPQIFRPSIGSDVLRAYFQNKKICGCGSAKIEFVVLLQFTYNQPIFIAEKTLF